MKKILILRIAAYLLFSILFCTSVFSQQNFGTHGTAADVKTISVSEALAIEAAYPPNRPARLKVEKEMEHDKLVNPASAALDNLLPSNPVGIAATQSVHSNFLGVNVSETPGYYPPDCNGDISSDNQVMIPVNGRLKVYNVPTVTGTASTTTQTSSSISLASPVIDVDIDAFFANAGLGIANTSDPHVRYDRLSGRWFIAIIDVDHTSSNYLIIAMSPTGPLSGSTVFTKFYLQSSTGSATPNLDFLDYPTLGIDKFALYIGGNMFQAAYVGSPIYVVNKASLIANAATFNVWQYGTGANKSGSTASAGTYTPQGVHNDDPAATEGYLIGTDNAFFSKLDFKRVTNPGSATPILSADIAINVGTTAYPLGGQPSLGSARKLDDLDDRLFAAMIMKNKITGVSSLWTAHNIQVNASGTASAAGGRNASRWYQFGNLTGTPAILQSGTLFDNTAVNPRGFWIPSIAMSGQGHSLLGCSVSGPDRRAQVGIAGRYSGDAGGILQPYDSVTKVTTAFNPLLDPSAPERWGDYSQTVVDPKDNMTMWTFQHYCNNTNLWGLRAVQVKAPPPAQSPSATAVPANFCGSSVAVTINGLTTNNAGFFDPGADAGGPGFNRLTIICSGGIPVTNVVFVSATQVTCTINTNGQAAGGYTLTITNPDGQSVTAGFTLSGSCTVPLTLLDFTGKLVNTEAQLNWKTAQEFNFKGFDVEKSYDGSNFSFLANVAGKGNFSVESLYSLADKKPYPGNSYYRLKMIDRDGNFRYSNIVLIKSPVKSLAVTRMFPNPATDKFNIELVADKKQQASVMVFDMAGKKLISEQATLEPGLNKYQLNLTNLAAGIYFVQVKNTAGNVIEKTKLVKE